MRLLVALALSLIICLVPACVGVGGQDPSVDPTAIGVSRGELTGSLAASAARAPRPALLPVVPDKSEPGTQPRGGYRELRDNLANEVAGVLTCLGCRGVLVEFPDEVIEARSNALADGASNLEHRLPPPPPCISCPPDRPGAPGLPQLPR